MEIREEGENRNGREREQKYDESNPGRELSNRSHSLMGPSFKVYKFFGSGKVRKSRMTIEKNKWTIISCVSERVKTDER